MSTPAGEVGGMGGVSPYQQKRESELGKSVKRVAGSGGTTAPTRSPYGQIFKQDPKDPYVYMGSGSRIAVMSSSQAKQWYYQWDAKTKDKFLSQLSLAGADTGNLKDAQIAALWAQYVDSATAYNVAGRRISPWEVLGMDISQREVAAAQPKTVTQTSKSYNLSTAEDAHALFQGAAQVLLGRNPTKTEISRFKSILNKYEQANPTITTTTSNYIGSDLQSQSSKTSGGVTAASQQLMAQEEAKKNPEYGAYQAATNGMNWLMEMIGGG
jgi:hypothetical protein